MKKHFFSLFFIALNQFLFGQTKDQIIKFKIYRTDHITSFAKKPKINTYYYDTLGRTIKEDLVLESKNEKTTTTYIFNDSLLAKTLDTTFIKNVLVNFETKDFSYEFDNQNRIKSKTETSSDNRIDKEEYIYNSQNKLDSVLFYDNDSLKLNDEKPSRFVQGFGKNLNVNGYKSYKYLGKDTILIKECKNFYDDSRASLIQTIKNDSLDIYSETSWLMYSLSDSAKYTTTIKYLLKNGEIYQKESNQIFDISGHYFYKKDKQGLIIQTKVIPSLRKRKTYFLTTHKYYFRE